MTLLNFPTKAEVSGLRLADLLTYGSSLLAGPSHQKQLTVVAGFRHRIQ